MEASSTVAPAQAPTLEQVAQAQANELYDVIALISAVADGIEARVSVRADDELHYALRLAHMARQKVNAALDAFDPYLC